MTSLTFAKAMLHKTAEFVIPKTPLKLPHGYRRILEFVQLGEPIEDGSTDLQFGDFAVRLTPDDAFTKQFEVSHFGRDKAASMIDSPFLPDFPVEPSCGCQDDVSDNGRTLVFYGLAFLQESTNRENGNNRALRGTRRWSCVAALSVSGPRLRSCPLISVVH